jgi:hypothetical protein
MNNSLRSLPTIRNARKKMLCLDRITTTLPLHSKNSFKFRGKCMNWHSITGLIHYFLRLGQYPAIGSSPLIDNSPLINYSRNKTMYVHLPLAEDLHEILFSLSFCARRPNTILLPTLVQLTQVGVMNYNYAEYAVSQNNICSIHITYYMLRSE